MRLHDAARRRTPGRDDGFTIVELLMVMLIVGILLAIAIPAFVSVIGGAHATSAESDAGNALEAARNEYIIGGDGVPPIGFGATAAAVANLNGSISVGGRNDPLVFQAGPSTGTPAHSISILTGSSRANGTYDWIVLATYGAGTCYDIYDSAYAGSGAPAPGAGDFYAVVQNRASCAPEATSSGPVTPGVDWRRNSFPG